MTESVEPVLLTRREGGIVTVVLNRPDRMNAMNKPLWIELGKAMRAIAADDSVRCVVVRGAGGKAFSPGADIAEFESERPGPAEAEAYGHIMNGTVVALAECPHPVVALIEGNCVGAGLVIALACDLRICGEGSRFGVPVNRLGVTMPYTELAVLVARAGHANALEILLEARVFGAQEAKDKGLVTRIVPDGMVEAEAYAAARRIADGAPLVNRWHKKFVSRLTAPVTLSADEIAQSFACFGTEDYRTGYRAFLDKKKPEFQGR